MKLEFTVPGNPIPWKRARSNGKRRFNPSDMVDYQDAVAMAAAEAVSALPGRWPTGATYRVSVEFFRKLRTGTDLDRLLSNLLDGMEGPVYAEDRQVRGFGYVSVGCDRKNPRAVVRVEVL